MPEMLVRQITVKEVVAPDLGDRIKKAREGHEKTMEALCNEAGLSRTYWYDIEKESVRAGLPIETLRRIESALGVDFGVVIE